MKHLLWGAGVVTAIAAGACGGGARPAPTEPVPAKSACAVAAENVAGLVVKAKLDDLTPDQQPIVARVLTERCEADAWSDEAVACLTAVTDAPAQIETCGDMLSEAQEEMVEAQLDRELPSRADQMKADDAEMEGGSGDLPKGAPAPPPPPDDPCGGGA